MKRRFFYVEFTSEDTKINRQLTLRPALVNLVARLNTVKQSQIVFACLYLSVDDVFTATVSL